jgi:tetratricopeptide (TPR) repeat protein
VAAAAEKKAYELRNRTTELTRLQTEDLYYDVVTGEQEKAYPVLLQWVQTFPRDFIGHNNLTRCLGLLGQPDRAADEAREAARILPTPWSYRSWMFSSVLADRLEEAKAVFDDAKQRKFDTPDLREDRVLLSFLQQDEPAMQEEWNWAAGKPLADRFLFGRSRVKAYYGRFGEAHHLSEQAINLAAKSDAFASFDNVAFDNGQEALDEAEVGNSAEAQRAAVKALASAPNRPAQLVVALAFARIGDFGKAQKLADTLNQDAPLDTLVQYYCLPTIRAAMKLHANDPAGAVEVLRPTVKYDLGYPTGFNSLYPAYIRGPGVLADWPRSPGSGRVPEVARSSRHRGKRGYWGIVTSAAGQGAENDG